VLVLGFEFDIVVDVGRVVDVRRVDLVGFAPAA
jgi:hypothetical protein